MAFKRLGQAQFGYNYWTDATANFEEKDETNNRKKLAKIAGIGAATVGAATLGTLAGRKYANGKAKPLDAKGVNAAKNSINQQKNKARRMKNARRRRAI